MTYAVTPDLALAYLRELSGHVPAASVRTRDGALLAGDAELPGDVIRARAGAVEVAVAPGPLALPGLARHDAELVARALADPESAA